ncbi:hypothetical protein TNCV_841151 [Trichonephila clavipes]|nr:hypothetical protein TNCV_841151 [Trichonephila clavipes]
MPRRLYTYTNIPVLYGIRTQALRHCSQRRQQLYRVGGQTPGLPLSCRLKVTRFDPQCLRFALRPKYASTTKYGEKAAIGARVQRNSSPVMKVLKQLTTEGDVSAPRSTPTMEGDE